MSVHDIDERKPQFTVLALCMRCEFRWIGTVVSRTSLFALECPECAAQDSFAAFVPGEYLQEFSGRLP